MNSWLSILLIAGFLGIAIFGFMGMDASGHGHMDCIATAVQGKVCPEALGAAGFINFHFNAARFFSTAVFGSLVIAVLAMLLTLALITLFLSRWRDLPLIAKYRLPQFLLAPASLPKDSLNYWLLLHEKRDPSYFFSFRPI
ncbi:MAG: hypothetical protein HYT65_03345 [Candidatus Yanofskybacteria bacterium]|nr:hypothetical protein [Candidatus Yanofskybacteria bacterium]